MKDAISIGLIGLGYWGANYFRILMQLSDVQFKYICDKDPNILSKYSKYSKFLRLTEDPSDLASDEELDAVIVSTPASTHYEVAKLMLNSGKHVLLEKPLTLNYNKALELKEISEDAGRMLMVGHVYCYNPAVNYIKELLERNELGELQYGIGLRLGLGPIRSDASCVWDLAVHDISILDYILSEMPYLISAHASSFLQKGVHDYTSIQLKYRNGFQFSLIVSWYAAEKIRMWYLMGSSKMKFDDMNKSSPLVVYDRGVAMKTKNLLQMTNFVPREGDVLIPYVPQAEPLTLEVQHFIDCIKNGKKPITDVDQGLRVVKVLEVIEVSIRNNKEIRIDY